MRMITDFRRPIIAGMLTAGWLVMAHPLVAQEMESQSDAPAETSLEANALTFDNETPAPMATEEKTETGLEAEARPADTIAPTTAHEQSPGNTPAPMATPEKLTTVNTETNARTDTTTSTTTPPDQIDLESVTTPDAGPQSTATNINAIATNSPATTNTPPDNVPGGDSPGWWFTAAQQQQGDYPAFLGVRFAKASRAIIIETPIRKLAIGQPLVYQLWICNDLPQPVEIKLEHAVWKGGDLIRQKNTAGLMIKGSEARCIDRFQQNTGTLAPGLYTIDATLRDQAGNLLHHMTETVELTAPQSP